LVGWFKSSPYIIISSSPPCKSKYRINVFDRENYTHNIQAYIISLEVGTTYTITNSYITMYSHISVPIYITLVPPKW